MPFVYQILPRSSSTLALWQIFHRCFSNYDLKEINGFSSYPVRLDSACLKSSLGFSFEIFGSSSDLSKLGCFLFHRFSVLFRFTIVTFHLVWSWCCSLEVFFSPSFHFFISICCSFCILRALVIFHLFNEKSHIYY